MTNRDKLHLAVSACGMRTTLEEIIKMLDKHKEDYIVRMANDLRWVLARYEGRYNGQTPVDYLPCGIMLNFQKDGQYGYTGCILPTGHEGNCCTDEKK